ncbi:MAG: disulfide reductase, partial [Candidatus Cloacimonetes bacterium]|nr:disulfide reductase [Candidatus Cloacimonadota bacterium]
RIGVFLCDCGGNLSRVIRFPDVVAALGKLADIGYVHLGHRLCSEEERERMVSEVQERGIDRVVIGACSPELYEGTFGDVLERAGMNPYLMCMANLREQCAWVYRDRGKATEKAKTLIRRALSRARLLEPIEQEHISVSRDVLVIGCFTDIIPI